MNKQTETKMIAIRERWTEKEREKRQDLAETMQRRLRQVLLRAAGPQRRGLSQPKTPNAAAC